MTINEAMRKYRLPSPTCSEDLECQHTRVDRLLTFGDKVVIAGFVKNTIGSSATWNLNR